MIEQHSYTSFCKFCIGRARIQKMSPLAFKCIPEKFLKTQEFCQKLAKVVENLIFAFWKKVF